MCLKMSEEKSVRIDMSEKSVRKQMSVKKINVSRKNKCQKKMYQKSSKCQKEIGVKKVSEIISRKRNKCQKEKEISLSLHRTAGHVTSLSH